MGVISRGCWEGAFFLLGSWNFEALEFFCCVCNHFCIFIFVSMNARKLHFTPFRWQTLYTVAQNSNFIHEYFPRAAALM